MKLNLPWIESLLLLGFAVVSASATEVAWQRTLDRTVASTNSPVVVTACFTNQSAVDLRGFCYIEQIPADLTVTPISIILNGRSITNFIFESGQIGDVYPGCKPYRWILEQPTDFPETNPIPPQTSAQISYALQSTNSGSFPLHHYGWIGYDAGNSNAGFAANPTGDRTWVNFLHADLAGTPTLTLSNQQAQLSFPTQPGVTYQVEFKHDLAQPEWIRLTNFIGTGAMAAAVDAVTTQRLYRIRLP